MQVGPTIFCVAFTSVPCFPCFIYFLPRHEHKLLESQNLVTLFTTVVLQSCTGQVLSKYLLKKGMNEAGGGPPLLLIPHWEFVVLSPPSGHFCVLRDGGEKCSTCLNLAQTEGGGGQRGQRAAPCGAPVICVLA